MNNITNKSFNSGTNNTRFCISTGKPETKGGQKKRIKINNNEVSYYNSPKNQARQLSGHKHYIKGAHTAELKMKSERNGIYGHCRD